MDCPPFKNLELHLDLKKLFISEVCVHVCSKTCKKWMQILLDCSHRRIVKSYSSVVVLSCSASAHEGAGLKNRSLPLCLIAVLSYQPVEFSRKTRSPALTPACSLETFTQRREGNLSLYFSLWTPCSICNHSKGGKKEKREHSSKTCLMTRALQILNYLKMLWWIIDLTVNTKTQQHT